MHRPKPAVSIDELSLGRRKRENKEHVLFDRSAHPAPATAKLTYRKGPLIRHVEVFTVFWGKRWRTTKTSVKMMDGLNEFFRAILVSSAIDQLAEYTVPGQTIGHGSLLGTKVIRTNAPVGSVTDSVIQTQVKKWVRTGTVPKATKNTLYFIYLDPDIVSILGGNRSCQNYCGYHSNIGKLYYAVMPYSACDGCLGGKQAFDALTGTSSHELCEAITDPVPGSGWYDDVKGEIGDVCASTFKQVAGFNVQLEWSNKNCKCV